MAVAKDAALAILFVILGAIAAMIGSIVLNGFVLSTLWAWFIVPTFALPALTLPVAIGISTLINLKIAPHFMNVQKSGQPELMPLLFYPFGALLFGWIVKQFM